MLRKCFGLTWPKPNGSSDFSLPFQSFWIFDENIKRARDAAFLIVDLFRATLARSPKLKRENPDSLRGICEILRAGGAARNDPVRNRAKDA
jgi:hypothetical protein